MEDTPFQPSPFPSFPDQPAATTQETATPKRASKPRTRKSSPATTRSAATSQKAADKPKRKYTRRAAATPAATPIVAQDIVPFNELTFVTDMVATLRALDTKTRARVMTAIGRLL